MTLWLFLALNWWPAQEFDHTVLDPLTGEITLAADNSQLLLHGDPSRWDVITDMVIYQGRLIAAASMDFSENSLYRPLAYSNGAQILEFSVAEGAWKPLWEQDMSMFFNIRVVGDRLLVPEYQAMQARSRMIHTFDGKEWNRLGLLPENSWHVMDVLKIGDVLYASGSWRDGDPQAHENDPHWFDGYGHVFESTDGGQTWRDLRRTPEPGRILDLVEFQGKLFANERGFQLISWDGTRWEEIPVTLNTRAGKRIDAKLGSAHLFVFAGKIIAINAALYYTFNGRAWSSHTPGYLDLWREGEVLYGLRDDGTVHETRDALKWRLVTRTGVPKVEFERQAERGRPLNRGAVAMHRGRLFVGTGSEGKIYAASCVKKGFYDGAPVEWKQAAVPQLRWEAATPEDSRIATFIRSARSAGELKKASWTPASSESPSPISLSTGHRWIQYRFELSTDGAGTPVLNDPGFDPAPLK